MKRVLLACACAMVLAGPAFAMQPPAAQGEYVPATPGAATEQLPAAPLVMTAYAFVWVATLAYVWTIARRLSKVEDDLHTLEQKATRPTR